jgi:holdfast attachment protein HfaA
MSNARNLTARLSACLLASLAAATVASAAHAQTMSNNGASFNAGYGRYADEENQAVNPSMADANGNVEIVNGVVTSAQPGSLFYNSTGINASATATAGADAFDSFSGAGGSSSATAIGNNLNVVTEGDNNTVIVTSVQSNSGNVSASTTGNGN